MPKKIKVCVIGPESTGKSTLCEGLSAHYNFSFVPEFARLYLEKHGPNYNMDDVLKMAKGQMDSESSIENLPIQIFDTNLYVFKVWIQEKYRKKIDWIEQAIANHKYDHYLLCDIDLPWEPDPFREHPDEADRQRLFDIYLRLLKADGTPFSIVSGDAKSRLNQSIEIINQL